MNSFRKGEIISLGYCLVVETTEKETDENIIELIKQTAWLNITTEELEEYIQNDDDDLYTDEVLCNVDNLAQ
jgi:hypothetical protein